MSTPGTVLRFRVVRGALPAFGATYEDVTRRGASSMRFRFVGNRAAEGELTGIKYFSSRSDALGGIAALKAAKGREVFVESDLDSDYRWRGFLMDVTPGVPRKVESTNSGDDYKLEVRLRMIATG